MASRRRRLTLRGQQLAVRVRPDQRVADRVLQPCAYQDVTHPFLALQRPVAPLRRQRVVHQRRRDLVVTDDPCDFLDQVGRNGYVEPEPGRGDAQRAILVVERFDGKLQTLQDVDDLGRRHVHAQDALDLDRFEVKHCTVLHGGIAILDPFDHVAGRQFGHHAGAANRGRHRHLGRDAFAEACRGLARQAQRLRRAPVIDVVEACRLEQDVAAPVVDLGLGAAHDTAHRDAAQRVGDHQHVGGKLPLDAVQRRHLLARQSPPHDNRRNDRKRVRGSEGRVRSQSDSFTCDVLTSDSLTSDL